MSYGVLDWTTNEGLFQADSGERFWVLNERYHKRVVRLDCTNGAPFTFFDLWEPDQFYAPRDARETTLIRGTWLGTVALEVGKPSDRTFKNLCGIVIKSDFRAYLKARKSYGKSIRLAIPGYASEPYERWSIFYPDWSLMLEVGDEPVEVFKSPSTPSPLRLRYPEPNRDNNSRPRLGPRLVWSAPIEPESE